MWNRRGVLDTSTEVGAVARESFKNKVTITEIARQAGVSVPTVSRVVNGRSDVSPETRARVEDLLRHHGYQRRPAAPGGRAALIDLVFNDLDSPWAVEIIRGVEEVAHASGVGTVVADPAVGSAALVAASTASAAAPATTAPAPVDLDPPHMRALARQLAEESVVLLANDGALPFASGVRRIAVLGPLADDPAGMLGCYSFPRHVLLDYPEVETGVTVPTLLEALRAELPDAEFTADPMAADVCVVVVGDRSGLFGRGTSGEGCDAADLELPGGQGEVVDTALAAGTPVVLVLLSGRPYALGRWADRCGAVVQAFFAGEEGGPAVAGVLSGRVNPSGRLPVSVPRDSAGQPWTYLAPPLGRRGEASTLDPTPLFPFGHGRSYTSYAWQRPSVDDSAFPTDGETTLRLTVRNTGERSGTEVVQLYLHDPVGKVARPVVRLIGYARVPLEAGASAEVHFTVPADLAAYTGPDGDRIVEPGELELRLAMSSADDDVRYAVPVTLTGPERVVGRERRMRCEVRVK
ncbi:LacI family DNA-binding transcriptional regulator [Streptomyces dengpaensis]|uniref:LacI family DNA-binding transcriptional regulator n=1 Tax=Streptomyces dengpaensis TaxID=2049881 RepID=A0ABN5I0X5_9ACTN|nr:LacI family DNA-binding transcriptional regulator [Streptomyces dengpaensis]